MNFSFAYGHTRFVVLHSGPGVTGEVEVRGAASPAGLAGPREEDLAFLDGALDAAEEPHRIVLMHMPPYLHGRFAPHAEWEFRQREAELLALLRARDVGLVCCAHGLALRRVRARRDPLRHVRRRRQQALLALPRRLHGGRREDRGSVFHAVEISISEAGTIAGRVIQAFDRAGESRIRFGDET
jgi:hypothetical protein